MICTKIKKMKIPYFVVLCHRNSGIWPLSLVFPKLKLIEKTNGNDMLRWNFDYSHWNTMR